MKFQIFTLFALLATVYARPGYLNAPAVAAVPAVAVQTHIAHYSVPAVAEVHGVAAVPTATVHAGTNGRDIYRSQDGFGNYAAGYSISDSLTGDFKSAHEQDVAGAKVGTFSFADPNGYERRTDYVSDGFGTRQVITGSEYGLYVNTPDHTIQPHDAPLVAAVAPGAEIVAAPVVAAAPAVVAAPVVAAAPAVVAAPVVAAAPAVGYAGHGYGYGSGLGYAGHGYGYGSGLGYAGHGYGYGSGLGYAGHGYGYGSGLGYAGLGYGYGLGGHGYGGAVGFGHAGLGYGYGSGLHHGKGHY